MAAPTYRGLPDVSRQIAAARRRCDVPSDAAAMNRPIASAPSPPRRMRCVCGSRSMSMSADVNGWSGVSSMSRYVPTRRIGISLSWAARKRRRRIDEASAAWRSSSTRRIGRTVDAFRSSVAAESNRRNRAESDVPPDGLGRSGNRSRSSGSICARSLAPAPSCRLRSAGSVDRRWPRRPGPTASRAEHRHPPAPTPEDLSPAVPNAGGQLIRQTAFADAGFTAKQDDTTTPGGGGRECHRAVHRAPDRDRQRWSLAAIEPLAADPTPGGQVDGA